MIVMMKYIQEAPKQIPVAGEYDVVVAGGGIAGIAAALAAVRQGAKTLLIEKEFALGGLATLGLVTIYLPLCDGNGRQVSFGICEELIKLSVKHGIEAKGAEYLAWQNGSDEDKKKYRYRVRFNAQIFAILAEQKLKEEGVEILYGTSVCDTVVNDGRVEALIIENKSGRQAILAKSVVDCTGDADIFHLAGARCAHFGQGNVLAAWHYSVDDGAVKLHMLGAADLSDEEKAKKRKDKGEGLMAEQFHLVDKRFSGVEGKELSEMMQLSHDKMLEGFLADGELTDKHFFATMPTIPQIRMTRRPVGKYEMDTDDDHKFFEDSIGMVGNWRKKGPIYEVPYRALIGDLKNVIAAGRCISNTDAMWDIMRVIPCCAVTGEAAGIAAAMGGDLTALDVSALQKKLVENGVELHI
ncbi:MAG: FAD-dependent oxidoreductase [Ruminococcaceae bacterium]|nr:FAD-dependent oxidoreductase [Oscillospiraceae bacterium]